MTAKDMIEGISAIYERPRDPLPKSHFTPIATKSRGPSRDGEDAEYSYDLVRTGDGSSFAMVVCSNGLAQAAISEAVRLEAQEAPQRELEEQKTRGRRAPRSGEGPVGEQVELPSLKHA
jgi:hypothetical protein